MSDPNKDELRRLAEAAIPDAEWFRVCDLGHQNIDGSAARFIVGCTPAKVKALLDECDRKDAELNQCRNSLQHMIDQTTPLEPVPGDPMWSRRIQLDQVIAERDAALAELEEMREELAGVKNVSIETAKAMKQLVMCARTSGGTAGPDAGLMDACEQAEKMLSLGGIGRAYMEGADAAMSQEAPMPDLYDYAFRSD